VVRPSPDPCTFWLVSGYIDPRTLGRSGLVSSRLGLGSGYGVDADDVEYAVDRGVTWLTWGPRLGSFGEGIRRVARRSRDQITITLQSYTRVASLLAPLLGRSLKKLGIDHADVLALGWWNEPPPPRILDAALGALDRGMARHLIISCHHRPTFASFIADPRYAAIMVRYNAAHPGAEKDIFPLLDGRAVHERPGVISYTATRWGKLLDPKLTPPGERTPRASDCYRFALSNPHVDVTLTGPKDRAQLDEALTALDRGPMSDDELAWMRRVGANVRAVTRSRRPPFSWFS